MRKRFPLFRTILVLLFIGWISACDSVDSTTSSRFDDNTSQVEADNAGGFGSKQGVDVDSCVPSPGTPCSISLQEPNNGPTWTVTFLGKDYNITHPGHTTFRYNIQMPVGASNSGKVALSIPTCCTLSEDLSDGNVNSNAATDIEFNTSQTSTNVEYVFVGQVWTNVVKAGLKVQSQTTPSNREDIYGPGVNPNHTISGYVFVDSPQSGAVGPNGTMDSGEGASGVIVTVFDEDLNAVDASVATDAQGHFSFVNMAPGNYRIEIRDAGGNGAYFDATQYLPADPALEGDSPYVLFDGAVGADTSVPPFGFVETYSLTGTIYVDTPVGNDLPNRNFDSNEPTIAGAVVAVSGGSLSGSLFSVAAESDGVFLIEGLRWGSYQLAFPSDKGINSELYNRKAYLPTEPLASGYDPSDPTTWYQRIPPYTLTLWRDVAELDFGFMVNVKGAIEAFDSGDALTTGLPREYWRVQATGKGSPKYQPEIDFDMFQGYMDQIEIYLAGKWSPFAGYDREIDAIPILKTESKNDIQEALRTEILTALLNYVSGRNTITVDGDVIYTKGFIDHALSVLKDSGYQAAGKIPSGSVAESEKLLEEANGGR